MTLTASGLPESVSIYPRILNSSKTAHVRNLALRTLLRGTESYILKLPRENIFKKEERAPPLAYKYIYRARARAPACMYTRA